MIIQNSPAPSAPSKVGRPTRFAYVGTGGRVRMFLDPIPLQFADSAEIVGLCDSSLVRANYHRDRLRSQFGYREVPVYDAASFGRMLQETRPDTVIVCTIDSEHDRYIAESLRAGCHVITEKPMTTTAEKCAAIFQAVAETGNSVRVAFNYRWGAGPTKVREVIASGAIGRVRHVTMEYLLNTSHGADYFRRWHAQKQNSGGLLVHKSTHHFDLVNWWTDAIPAQVVAYGALQFYGRQNAIARGDEALTRYSRYHGNAVNHDPFAYDYNRSMIRDPAMEQAIYLGAEKETGYVRDQNVFRDDIDIEDAMAVLVRYRDGTLLNYSLNAYSPYEGYRVAFNGDRGRIEYSELHGAHVIGSAAVGEEHLGAREPELRVFPHFQTPYQIQVPRPKGGHGGSDPLLQEQIFSPQPPADPFQRAAGHEQGAASILVGIAANQSIATGQPVDLSSLFDLKPAARRLSELQ
ncbi:MAG TPA: Gfo/Idh/MocA family oxidoreductase [Opitutus sp.]|nr:Gfo/Idh/MocA family oxidoreductase [Opitutus sp.]